MSTLSIRRERPEDRAAVREINLSAFPQPAEAQLVDRLRGEVEPWLSLVAVRDEQLLGHILFTPVDVESDTPWKAMALGPMAVVPEHQRQGIGSRLVRAGLEECLRLGEPIVFVLGHPEYYPKFGFTPAPPMGLSCPWDVPAEVFMVAVLAPAGLRGRKGMVRYHPAFDEV